MSVLAGLSEGTLSSPLGSYYDQRKTGGQVTKCQVLYKSESWRQFLVFGWNDYSESESWSSFLQLNQRDTWLEAKAQILFSLSKQNSHREKHTNVLFPNKSVKVLLC